MTDLRNNHDESAPLSDGKAKGMLYRKGGTLQAWWQTDVLGRTLKNGRETWTLPDSDWGIAEAKRNFRDMVESNSH